MPNLLSFSKCREICEDLRRFQDLIRHHGNWATHVPYAPPLEKLLPEHSKDGFRNRQILDREINKLIPLVARFLQIAGIPTILQAPNGGRKFHLIQDYFSLPHSPSAAPFEAAMAAVDQGIGYFERKQSYALKRLFFPTHWVGWLLGVPLRAMSLAGIETSNKIFAEAYAWGIRVIVLLSLIWLTAKLGVNISWQTLASLK